MRRTTIALLAGLEASVAALIGLGAALVPLMLLWALHFGLAVDLTVFLRAAGDIWLLGHGVDLVVQLDPVTAAGLGVPGAGDPFPITIAVLGFALISVVFGRRIGVRSAAEGHSFTGGLAAVAVYAAVGLAIALLAGSDAARPAPWQGALLPAFVMALGVVIGAVSGAMRTPDSMDAAGGMVRRAVDALPSALVDVARSAVRIGAGAAFGVLGVAAVLVAVLIALDYATIVGLSQSLGAGVDGGIAITLAELALLPNVVIWAAAWLLGPGFALGEGTSVSSAGTLLGPVPGIPLLGALPADAPVLGAIWLVVPVLFGFWGAWFVAAEVRPGADPRLAWWVPAANGLGAAAVAAAVLGLLAWWSGGAAGPGRLVEVGPSGWAVAGVAAATVGIGALVGGYTTRARGIRSRDEWPPAEPVRTRHGEP